MITALIIVCALIWLPTFFYQISQRPLVVLVIWLFIAPIATNLVAGRTNPLFTSPERRLATEARRANIATQFGTVSQTISPGDIFREPTRIIFMAFFAVIFFNAVLKRRRMLDLDRTEMLMCIFSLILITNTFLLAQRIPFSLRLILDVFIVPFLAYSVTRRIVINEDLFRKLVEVIGYLGFYLIIIGSIEQLAHQLSYYRLQGPFRSGTAYYYVMVVVFFTVFLESVCTRHIPKEKQALPRNIRLFVLYFTPVIILLTWSRGNWLGLLSGVWVFLFLGWRLINPSRRLGIVGIALILISIAAIGMQLLLPPESFIEKRLADEGTVSWRYARWNIAIQTALQQPIFGIGFNNLRDVLGRELGTYFTAHSFFLTFLTEVGVVGLLAYLAIVASIIGAGLGLYWTGIYAWDRWRGITVVAIMVAHLTPAFFADTLQAASLMLVYIYAFIGGVTGLYNHRGSVPDRGQSLVGNIDEDLKFLRSRTGQLWPVKSLTRGH